MSHFNKFIWMLGLVVLISIGLTALTLADASPQVVSATPTPLPTVRSSRLTGVVRDAAGPLAGVTVRIQATENVTTTAADGSFTLGNLTGTQPLTVTASLPGYYIGWKTVKPGDKTIRISLLPHFSDDNAAYDWFEHEGVEGSASCGLCHGSYTEWQQDAHGQSALNQRFLTMYQGSDVNGNRSPHTRYDWKTGKMLPPDLTQPYFGPGFRLDNPNRDGNCAACHTPIAAKVPNNEPNSGCGWSGCHASTTEQYTDLVPDGVSPLYLEGHAAEGITCEFCHKIGAVLLNPARGLPDDDKPGILSLKLLRPQEGHQLFFGPLDDIARTDTEPRDSYLPLQKESAFCASCHYGVFGGVVNMTSMKMTGGVVIYNSYGEWLESSYSDPESGQTCQDCHMPQTGGNHIAFPEKGGVVRPPDQVHTHKMPGASDVNLLQNAVTMTATTTVSNNQLAVAVDIVNDSTGHYVPTDSPLRQVLLVITAKDSKGKALPLAKGQTLPDWTGNYAGQPGRYFAQILRDKWTDESPTVAFWREISLVEDTRLAPFVTNQSRYNFQLPVDSSATVEVKLIYRRAYQQLAQWKGWDDPDIVMEQATLKVTPGR